MNKQILRRWTDVVLYAIVGALAFEVLLPIGWVLSQRLPVLSGYQAWFVTVVAWLGAFALAYIASAPIRIRAEHWKFLHRYPPLWFSVIIGFGFAAVSETLPAGFRPRQGPPDWARWYVLLPLMTTFVAAVTLQQVPFRHRRPTRRAGQDASSLDWTILSTWMSAERPVQSGEPDLFDHKPVSARIARALLHSPEDQSIALLGPFGSGKSSILSWVRDELEQAHEGFTIFAEFNCWAMPRSEDAPRIALERIVEAFDRFADVQRFRGLPKAYQRLIAAEQSGRLATIIGADGERDPLEELKRLTPVLESLNARIVLFIEDADRTGRRFESHHLERLLWTLRDVPRVSFVLSIDPTHARFDYRKLCDIIEIVPATDPERVLAILSVAHKHWIEDVAFIDPRREARQGSRLDLDSPTSELLEYFHRASRNTPTHALTALLSSPRRIKHLVRRVDRTWDSLRGEVDLDDVIVLTALRDGDRAVFDFIVENIDPARQESKDIDPRTKTIKDDWKKLLESVPNVAAVETLVNLLGIKQLSTGGLGRSSEAVQGVHNEEPDYFRRVLAEQLAPGEISDQSVLRDMNRWQQDRAEPMFSKLCVAGEESRGYVRVWEYFSSRLTDNELYELAEGLIQNALRKDGSSANMERESALTAVWRCCNRRRVRIDAVEWLSRMIAAALPVSLRFADDLFYYWGSFRTGILPEGGRAQVRVAMLSVAKKTFTDAQALLRTLRETHIPANREGYALLHFLQPPSGGSAERVELSERGWLTPLLIDAARARPNVVVPSLVLMVGKTHDSILLDRTDGPQIDRVYSLEREKVTEFFGDQTDEVLATFAAYEGDDRYAHEAQGQAETWLAERRALRRGAAAPA